MKIVLLLFCTHLASSHKILGIFPCPMKSHHAVFDPLMVELARRGHEVVDVNTFPVSRRIPNYHHIDIKSCFKLSDILAMDIMNSLRSVLFAVNTNLKFNPAEDEILSCQPLIKLLNSVEKFDLLITESFTTDFFLLYAKKFNVPVIAYHSNLPYAWQGERIGMPYNPSYIPSTLGGFPPNMGFMERLTNFLATSISLIMYERHSFERYNKLVPEFYGLGMPPLQDIVKNTSLIFFYSHFTNHVARPLVPNAVEVGGMHIKESKSLPQVRIETLLYISKETV